MIYERKDISIIKFFIVFLSVISVNPLSSHPLICTNDDNIVQSSVLENIMDETTNLHLPISSSIGNWVPNGINISGQAGSENQVQILVDDLNNTYFSWLAYTGNYDIYVSKIDSDGNPLWGANGVVACADLANQFSPSIVLDGSGGLFCVWKDERHGMAQSDIYGQHFDMNGLISWAANGIPIVNAESAQIEPRAISDGGAGAIIYWNDYRNGNYDIFGQRIDINGNHQWQVNGTGICNVSNEQYDFQVVDDGSGGSYIAWRDLRLTSNYSIYVDHIDSNGNTLWTGNGTLISDNNYRQYNPEIASNGTHAFITWEERRGTTEDIYAQMISSSGIILWDENGTIVDDSPYKQHQPEIHYDDSMVYFVYQSQEYDGITDHIKVQKLSDAGTSIFGEDGFLVSPSGNSQAYGEIQTDLVGNLVVLWHENRYLDNDIFIQGFDETGNKISTEEGTRICNATNTQSYPYMAKSSTGAIFIVWEDNRNGSYDMYLDKFFGFPISSSPSDIVTEDRISSINWVVFSEYDTVEYKVVITDGDASTSIYIDWTSASTPASINVPLDYSSYGNFSYTLLYRLYGYDIYGKNDSVQVEILNRNPWSSEPEDVEVAVNAHHTILWVLYDDFCPNEYRINITDEEGSTITLMDWTSWNNGSTIPFVVITNVIGTFNYTIEFNTGLSDSGFDLVRVKVISGDSLLEEILKNLLGDDYLAYLVVILAVVEFLSIYFVIKGKKTTKKMRERLDNLETKLASNSADLESEKKSLPKRKGQNDKKKKKKQNN